MKRNRGDVINALARLLVQRFDVAKGVAEAQPGRAHFAGGQAVKHKGVVGVGAVSHRDLADIAGRRGNSLGLFRNYGHEMNSKSKTASSNRGASALQSRQQTSPSKPPPR